MIPIALETEFVAQLPHLRALALRLCGRPDEADDLVQEVAARALRHVRALPPGANLKAWMRRVLRNLFIDAWRRRVRDAVEPMDDLDALPANEDREAPPRWAALDMSELREAMSSLSPAFRSVYELHAEGHDYDTIAARLGVRKATVGTRLHRARHKLRRILEPRLAKAA